jgi:hypothetical protein
VSGPGVCGARPSIFAEIGAAPQEVVRFSIPRSSQVGFLYCVQIPRWWFVVRGILGGAMARPLRIEFAGALYHLTSRGNERRNIFRSDRDRKAFLVFLGLAARRFGWSVTGWVLMTNHFHLVIRGSHGLFGESGDWRTQRREVR